jgi:DNA-binding NarL/FixJ family response regulator
VQKPDVRFVVTSVFFDIDIKEKLIVEGVNAFIQKPYQPENILKVVREVLDSKPA